MGFGKVLVLVLGAGVLAQPRAWAAPLVIERDTTNTINTGTASFAGASDAYSNVFLLDTGAGTFDETFTFEAAGTSIVLAGQGGTTVMPTSVPDGTSSSLVSVTSPGGSGQGYTVDYSMAASSVPGQSYITTSVVGGVSELEFSDGGANLLDQGGKFVSTIVLSGDWSNPANHSAVTYNPDYTVDQNFVFDGTNTIFSIEDDAYVTGDNPLIDFTLYGSTFATAVPEPASVALLGGSLLGFGFTRRRRR